MKSSSVQVTSSQVYFKSKTRIALTWLMLLVSFQFCALVGQGIALNNDIHSALDKVERRISLDSAFLDVGNETLNTPVNHIAIYRYLDRLNATLKEQQLPIRVKSIQDVATSSEDFTLFANTQAKVLTNAEQEISIVLQTQSILHSLSFSWLALALSVLVTPAFAVTSKAKSKASVAEEPLLPPQPKLVINLRDKTISNGIDDKVVTLQNKPLCFYTALVKYCIDHPGEALPPHKDVPQELMSLANKSFGRLIELGHTKRKRPDFNANLDKTLSEIRAALDEVFSSFVEEKETYYPPRAQGEGSRSKQHSYALTHIKKEDIEIIGN